MSFIEAAGGRPCTLCGNMRFPDELNHFKGKDYCSWCRWDGKWAYTGKPANRILFAPEWYNKPMKKIPPIAPDDPENFGEVADALNRVESILKSLDNRTVVLELIPEILEDLLNRVKALEGAN